LDQVSAYLKMTDNTPPGRLESVLREYSELQCISPMNLAGESDPAFGSTTTQGENDGFSDD
jgi:hypothetical protein